MTVEPKGVPHPIVLHDVTGVPGAARDGGRGVAEDDVADHPAIDGLYAKTLASPARGQRIALRFTSLPPEARAFLASLRPGV